jgi:hypothetical protein
VIPNPQSIREQKLRKVPKSRIFRGSIGVSDFGFVVNWHDGVEDFKIICVLLVEEEAVTFELIEFSW